MRPKFTASFIFAGLLLLWAGYAKAQSPAPPTFLVGGDLSYLAREEHLGAVYKENGKPVDALHLFKSRGWNIVRLRLWVNPPSSLPQWDNLNDLPYTLALAKRVKKAGFKFLLDLHYSDTWADPGHQTKPAAWKDLTFDQLTQQVRSYSRNVISTFRRGGAMPDIVAVGNETTNGMLWPDGKVESPHGWQNYRTLVKAGIAGIREGALPQSSPKIMLHIHSGADVGLVQWFFNNLNSQAQGIQFDSIGLSYYPDGKNTLDQLQASLDIVARKYHKPIIIAETAYPHAGTPKPDQAVYSKYGLTPEGQRHFLADLAATVQETPDGLGHGVIYWQPEWVPIHGLANYSNATALFDDQFNALPGVRAIANNR